MEKILHQIWVGPYPMPDRERSFVLELLRLNPGIQHHLWTNKNLPALPQNIFDAFESFEKQKDYAHQADILRAFLVSEFGGIYLDVDFKPISAFTDEDFWDFDGVFCYHGGDDFTMPNGFFGCKKNSSLSKFLVSQIDIKKNGWYGPSWLGDTVKIFFDLIREADHEIVGKVLKKENINYLLFPVLESKFAQHHALYSWSPENKRNFEKGNINYLKNG